jgi:hypothetical protein
MEKLIPISRKQHDAINELRAQIRQAETELIAVGKAIVLGQAEDIPVASVQNARCVDGVYSLVLIVPDPPKPE